MSFLDVQKQVSGFRLPGGTFSVADYERFLSHDAMGSPPLPTGILHPCWILLGALRGMGMSMEEVSHVAGADEEDIVLFGETTLTQNECLSSEKVYTVHGEIASLVELQGKRGGAMHRYELLLNIRENARQVASASLIFLILKGARHA